MLMSRQFEQSSSLAPQAINQVLQSIRQDAAILRFLMARSRKLDSFQVHLCSIEAIDQGCQKMVTTAWCAAQRTRNTGEITDAVCEYLNIAVQSWSELVELAAKQMDFSNAELDRLVAHGMTLVNQYGTWTLLADRRLHDDWAAARARMLGVWMQRNENAHGTTRQDVTDQRQLLRNAIVESLLLESSDVTALSNQEIINLAIMVKLDVSLGSETEAPKITTHPVASRKERDVLDMAASRIARIIPFPLNADHGVQLYA